MMIKTKKYLSIFGKAIDYFAVPALIFFICYDPKFYNGFLVTNDEGIHLSIINGILRGKALYRDMFFMYGPLMGYLPALLMKIFSPSLVIMRGFVHLGSIFTIISAYFLSRTIIKTRFFLFLLTWLILVTKIHAFWSSRWGGMRAGLGFLALITIVIYFRKKRWHWLGLGGFLAGVTFLFSQDIGICVLFSVFVCLTILSLFHSSIDKRAYFKIMLIYLASFLITLFPFLIYALTTNVLLPYFQTCFIDVPFKFPKFFAIRYPFLPLPKTLSSAEWGAFLVSRTFYFYGSIFVYLIGGIYFLAKIIRKKLTDEDICLLSVLSFGVVLLKLVTRQLDGGQFNMAAPPILITVIFLMERLFFRGKQVFKEYLKLKDIKFCSKNTEVGRNDLCLCGSGRKFKNCCLNKKGLKNILTFEMIFIIFVFMSFFYFINFTSRPYQQIVNMIKTYKRGEAVRFLEHELMLTWEQFFAVRRNDWGKLDFDRAQGVLVPGKQAQVFTSVVKYIKEHTSPDEPIFVFSHNAQYHFFADRLGVTRFYSVIYSSMDPNYQQEIITALEESKLRYIIYVADAYVFTESDKIPNEVRLKEVFTYMQNNYIDEARVGNTFILRRKS